MHFVRVRFGRYFAADRLSPSNRRKGQYDHERSFPRQPARRQDHGRRRRPCRLHRRRPLIIRLAFVAAVLITGPVAILFYLLTGLLADR